MPWVTDVGEAIDLSDDQVHSGFALAMMVDDDPKPQPTQQWHKEALNEVVLVRVRSEFWRQCHGGKLRPLTSK
jgi:hypothetical protein